MQDVKLANVQQSMFEALSRVGQALSSPCRLMMLGLLGQGEKSVEVLSREIGQSVANTSAHLQAMKAAHLVTSRREGRHIHYSLASPGVLRLWLALREMGVSQLPELRELVREHFLSGEAETFDPRRLLREVESGRILLLDLRPADEYSAGRLPGARSIPLEDLKKKLSSLPKHKGIAIYCRGPYCLATLEAQSMLKESGFEVRRLPVGVPEWRAASLPVETEPGVSK